MGELPSFLNLDLGDPLGEALDTDAPLTLDDLRKATRAVDRAFADTTENLVTAWISVEEMRLAQAHGQPPDYRERYRDCELGRSATPAEYAVQARMNFDLALHRLRMVVKALETVDARFAEATGIRLSIDPVPVVADVDTDGDCDGGAP